MSGRSSPASLKMSATPSATTALSRICLSTALRRSSDSALSVSVALAITVLMAWKNAISSRSATASSSVPHSEKALVMPSTTSAQRFLPSSCPSTWLAAGISSFTACVR